jgi:DNA-binding LacI/PurR family transcriptional regulator
VKNPSKLAKTTIVDIAKASGVSVSTVSRILNNKPDVAEETRQRVLQIIEEHRFAPQAPWQQLASGKSHFITLHYPLSSVAKVNITNYFFLGAAEACEEKNYSLNLIVSPLNDSTLLTLFRGRQTDGIILMEVFTHDWRVDLLRRNGFPFVMIGRCEENTGLNYIDLDIEAGIQNAMTHLLELGHRRIGFVSIQHAWMVYSGQRHNTFGYNTWALNGYRKFCEQHGLAPLWRCVDGEKERVEMVTIDFIKGEPQMTAVITAQDEVVPGIIRAGQTLGLRIPQDISVMGVLNDQMALLTTPPLTSLRYPSKSVGYQAARLLIDQLEAASSEPKQILVPFELIIRGSTGPAR